MYICIKSFSGYVKGCVYEAKESVLIQAARLSGVTFTDCFERILVTKALTKPTKRYAVMNIADFEKLTSDKKEQKNAVLHSGGRRG